MIDKIGFKTRIAVINSSSGVVMGFEGATFAYDAMISPGRVVHCSVGIVYRGSTVTTVSDIFPIDTELVRK